VVDPFVRPGGGDAIAMPGQDWTGGYLEPERAGRVVETLAELLPDDVAIVAATEKLAKGSLLEDEARFTGSMVPKRRAEFTAGRVTARAALEKLGHEPGPIAIGPSREPVWPQGVVGSISHTGAFCAAAVAESRSVESLGLDIEEATPLEHEVQRLVCRPEELDWLEPVAAQTPWAGKLIFSAKESIYKCWFPIEGVFLDFLEATVSVDLSAQRWSGVIHKKSDRGFPSRISGGFRIYRRHLFTACFLPS